MSLTAYLITLPNYKVPCGSPSPSTKPDWPTATVGGSISMPYSPSTGPNDGHVSEPFVMWAYFTLVEACNEMVRGKGQWLNGWPSSYLTAGLHLLQISSSDGFATASVDAEISSGTITSTATLPASQRG